MEPPKGGNMGSRKLYRSRKDRMLFGVLGGLAEYFDLDATIVRVVFVLIVLATGGFGIIAYVIMSIIFPVEGIPDGASPDETMRQNVKEMAETADNIASGLRSGFKRGSRPVNRAALIAGLTFIVLGVVFLLANFGVLKWLTWNNLWPLLLIIVGILLLVGLVRRRR